MEDLNYKEMIYAYAAGCLDKDELPGFINHLSSVDIDTMETGELQNVISLLPIILELEYPNPGLKDKIAKRLSQITNEIIDKRKQEMPPQPEIEQPVIEEQPEDQPIYEEPLGSLTDISPVINEPVEEITDKEEVKEAPVPEGRFERLTSDDLIFEETQEKEIDTFKETTHVIEPELPLKEEKIETKKALPEIKKELIVQEIKEKSRASLYILLGILFIISVVLFYFYISANNELRNNNKQISLLNDKVISLNNEIIRIDKVQRILSILGSKDVQAINLNGTVNNPTGFGKLIVDYKSKEGLLQLYNMPTLSGNQFYSLWLTGNGNTFLLGSYKPKKNVEYLVVNQLPEIQQNQIDSFSLTIENNENPVSPKGIQYLSATLQNTNSGK